MEQVYGKAAFVVGATLLFFALMKIEYVLWDAAATATDIAYNPVPFVIGGIFFIGIALLALHRYNVKSKKIDAKTASIAHG